MNLRNLGGRKMAVQYQSFVYMLGNISAAENCLRMTASHRKFGDLLEEGIKRVHITRKKPIGYILDEFGYELRPDDSSKGRYSLGHWYYKKRIPASMDDVATLAKLIVTNSDVGRDWLKAFLDSAGYVNSDALCDQFFLPDAPETVTPEPALPQDASATGFPIEQPDLEIQPAKQMWSPASYILGLFIVIAIVGFFFWGRGRFIPSAMIPDITSTITEHSVIPTLVEQKTQVPTVTETPPVPTVSPTADYSSYDGKCPATSSSVAFEYTSPQSFRDFLNKGGSFIALKSGFDTLIQKKGDLKDGRMISSDLDLDGIPEIIISAILEKGSIWQILGCDADEYKALVDAPDADFRYLRFAVDLNGNEFPEIISYRQTQQDSVAMYEFFVDEWNGHQIADRIDPARFEAIGKRLPSDITDWQRKVANATVTTRDTNGDSLFEVIVTGGLLTPVPTCETRFERQFTDVWTWNGQSMQFMERLYIPPIYRFQRSADGDLAFALKQYDLALDAYQDVLFDANLYRRDQYRSHLEYCGQLAPTIDPVSAKDEPELLQAYAYWRILLINTLQDSQDSMELAFQTLQEKFPMGKPGHSYAVIASEFWKSYQSTEDINAACAAANLAGKNQTLYTSHKAENICFIP